GGRVPAALPLALIPPDPLAQGLERLLRLLERTFGGPRGRERVVEHPGHVRDELPLDTPVLHELLPERRPCLQMELPAVAASEIRHLQDPPRRARGPVIEAEIVDRHLPHGSGPPIDGGLGTRVEEAARDIGGPAGRRLLLGRAAGNREQRGEKDPGSERGTYGLHGMSRLMRWPIPASLPLSHATRPLTMASPTSTATPPAPFCSGGVHARARAAPARNAFSASEAARNGRPSPAAYAPSSIVPSSIVASRLAYSRMDARIGP